ncbi:hypothetical protein CHU92_01880 [Flavobacterium cyanobacteriorum]|uniref:Periplasmic heavy metal sensor n=1 Tax=Flavobacterium cyanobacteriorum TaxID=2022802 RepID=A0A255ZW30_9FLAO|nr:hypothetical protein [Flavobacterium cyanobacteriorum]OYQ45602.1 hypothetical protein CHU92_01880 [Flavobacterium cyanobacteriorum]
MKKQTFLYLIIVVLAMGNIILFVLKNQNHGHSFHGQGPKDIIIKKLDFDQGQVADYEKLIGRHRKDVRENDLKILKLKNELYGLLSKNKPTVKPDSLIALIGNIQENIETIHYRHFLDIKAICRPGQVKRFNALSLELSGLFDPKNNLPDTPR